MPKKPLLSIALLASNRADTIRRCLDSLVPIMEQIPSELIILDTSTDPQVPPILAEYTDNITKFTWIHDFSVARNETVKRAKGEWYLYLDDDEWFTEIEELIHFFKSGEYKKYGCANYIQRNFHDFDLVHYSDSWVSRMIRMTPETHFESKIHEYLVPVPGECKNLHLIANHTGYVVTSEDDGKKRFERNYVLLKEMMEEEPERLRWRVQIVQEYHSMKMWQELKDFCLENLEFTKNRTDKWDSRDIGTFYGGATEGYFYLKEYQKSLDIGQKGLQDKRCSELCHAYIYLRFAAVGFAIKNWRLARKSIESYFLIRKELEKMPKKLANQEGALLINEAFDAVPTRRAYSILIGAGLKEKTTQPLHTYLPKLDWKEKVIYVYEPLIPILIEGMAELPYEPIFAETMQLMWNNAELQIKVLSEINNFSQKDIGGYEKLLYILSQITGEHWFIWYAKVLMINKELEYIQQQIVYVTKTSKQDSKQMLKVKAEPVLFVSDAVVQKVKSLNNMSEENVQLVLEELQKIQELTINTLIEALLGLFKNIRNVFQMPQEIKQIANKYNISWEGLYLSVPYEKWQEDIHNLIEKYDEQTMLMTEAELKSMQTTENIRFDYFFARTAEAKVLYHASEQNYNKRKNYLKEFSQKTLAFLRKYYQPQVFEEAMELLPAYGQAGLLIEYAFTIEENNPTEMLRILKDVAEVYPTFASVIRGFISAYGVEQQEIKRRQKEEMRNLKAQILGEVQKLVKKKQYTEALSIVQQLKQMCPNDLELVTLGLELRLAMLG